jgi:hypothetical protein
MQIGLHESEDRASWTPLGVSQAISTPGPLTLSHAAASKRFVRVRFETTGAVGQTVTFKATLEVTTP